MHAAYKFVAIALMLIEVNFAAVKLRLPIEVPIRESDLRYKLVAPPEFGWGICCGRIDANGYAFGFSHQGTLQFIWKIKPFGEVSTFERNELLSKQSSVIGEGEAYKIATNWLASMGIDVKALEIKHPSAVRQQFRWKPADIRKKDMLPIFDVKWGPWENPKVFIEIDGRNRGLLHLRLEDESITIRSPPQIKDRNVLVGISDKEFASYTEKQRSELLERFVVIKAKGDLRDTNVSSVK